MFEPGLILFVEVYFVFLQLSCHQSNMSVRTFINWQTLENTFF